MDAFLAPRTKRNPEGCPKSPPEVKKKKGAPRKKVEAPSDAQKSAFGSYFGRRKPQTFVAARTLDAALDEAEEIQRSEEHLARAKRAAAKALGRADGAAVGMAGAAAAGTAGARPLSPMCTNVPDAKVRFVNAKVQWDAARASRAESRLEEAAPPSEAVAQTEVAPSDENDEAPTPTTKKGRTHETAAAAPPSNVHLIEATAPVGSKPQRQLTFGARGVLTQPAAAPRPPHPGLLAAPDASDPRDTSRALRLQFQQPTPPASPRRRGADVGAPSLSQRSDAFSFGDDEAALLASCDAAIGRLEQGTQAAMSTAQRRVATAAVNVPTLVVAGAGSGKTHTIVQRVVQMCNSGGVDAREVLLVTFTNKACDELAERVSTALGASKGPAPVVKTFHGLANFWVGQYWRFLGFSCRPVPLTTDAAQRKLMLKTLREAVVGPLRLRRAARALNLVPPPQPTGAASTAGVSAAPRARVGWSTVLAAFQERWPETYSDLVARAEKAVKKAKAAKKKKVKGDAAAAAAAVEAAAEAEADELFERAVRHELGLEVYLHVTGRERVSKKDDDDLSEKWLTKQCADEYLRLVRKARSAGHAPADYLPTEARVWTAYEAALKAMGQVDFDLMLHLFLHLLKGNLHARDRFGSTHRVLVVDEYQDNCAVQTDILLEMVAATRGRAAVTVVGDDDQCIYSFRGAEVGNFERFAKHFDDAGGAASKRFVLEDNYRCSGQILRAAAALLKRCKQRSTDKVLKATRATGDAVVLFQVDDDARQAHLIADEIAKRAPRYSDCAVLFRCFNFGAFGRLHSKLELALAQRSIPYRVVGSKPVLATKVALDVAAYMSLAHASDGVAFQRVFNTPPRRLSVAVFQAVERNAQLSGAADVEAAARRVVETGVGVTRAQRDTLKSYLDVIGHLRVELRANDCATLVDIIWKRAGFEAHAAKRAAKAQQKQEDADDDDEPDDDDEASEASEDDAPPKSAIKETDALPDAVVALRCAALVHVREWCEAHAPPDEDAAGPPSLYDLAKRQVLKSRPGDGAAPGEAVLPRHLADDLSTHLGVGAGALAAFLSKISLQSAVAESGGDDNRVVISTIHRSKGLEWSNVFVPFFNDTFMPCGFQPPRETPHTRHAPECRARRDAMATCGCAQRFPTADDGAEARHSDEERRLAHVAATRARDSLVFVSLSRMWDPKKREHVDLMASPLQKDLEAHARIDIISLVTKAAERQADTEDGPGGLFHEEW